MPLETLKVMISSTVEDLQEYRLGVRWGLQLAALGAPEPVMATRDAAGT